MFLRSEMKFSARQCLSGNWGPAAVATLCVLLVMFPLAYAQQMTTNPSMTNLLSLLLLLVEGPLMIAAAYFFLPLSRTAKADINHFFQGFEQIGKAILAGLWHSLWIFLWGLLLIIPGIIKLLAYSQYFYILAENPQADLRQALKTSIKMTNGYKMELFLLDLSFIGWYFAVIFTAGLALFYVGPYMNTTYCKIYDYLKQQALRNGICTPEEFGMAAAESQITSAYAEDIQEEPDQAPETLLDQPTAIQQKELEQQETGTDAITTTATYICRLTKPQETERLEESSSSEQQQTEQPQEQS